MLFTALLGNHVFIVMERICGFPVIFLPHELAGAIAMQRAPTKIIIIFFIFK